MPTNKPRMMITFNDKELHDRVETYRFENRFKSQNDALMALLDKGIEIMMGENPSKPKEEISHEEKRVLRAYRNADPNAQRFALQLLENNPIEKKAANK